MLDIFIEDGLGKGYLDFDKIMDFAKLRKTPFIFIVGARGIGKTYNSLDYCRKHNKCFMYIRRLASQLEVCKTEMGQPFRPINNDYGCDIRPMSLSKTLSGFFNFKYDEQALKSVPIGKPLGYMSSLSTFANLNSASFPDVEMLIFDEFIAKASEHPIKEEASSYFGFYETIARNREIQGKEPLYSICMANSNKLVTPLFMELKLVNKLLQNREKGNDYFVDSNRGILVIDITNSEISTAKKDTALYRLTNDTSYSSMAIENDFVDYDDDNVIYRKLTEYVPLVCVGELYIYQHKNELKFYVSSRQSGTFNSNYKCNDTGLRSFMIAYGSTLRGYYIAYNLLEFENFTNKALFEKYVDIQ